MWLEGARGRVNRLREKSGEQNLRDPVWNIYRYASFRGGRNQPQINQKWENTTLVVKIPLWTVTAFASVPARVDLPPSPRKYPARGLGGFFNKKRKLGMQRLAESLIGVAKTHTRSDSAVSTTLHSHRVGAGHLVVCSLVGCSACKLHCFHTMSFTTGV